MYFTMVEAFRWLNTSDTANKLLRSSLFLKVDHLFVVFVYVSLCHQNFLYPWLKYIFHPLFSVYRAPFLFHSLSGLSCLSSSLLLDYFLDNLCIFTFNLILLLLAFLDFDDTSSTFFSRFNSFLIDKTSKLSDSSCQELVVIHFVVYIIYGSRLRLLRSGRSTGGIIQFVVFKYP